MSAGQPREDARPSLEGVLRAIDERGGSVVVHVETSKGLGQFSVARGVLRGAAYGEVSGIIALDHLLDAEVLSIELHEVTEPPPLVGDDGNALKDQGPRISELLEVRRTTPRGRSGFFSTMKSEEYSPMKTTGGLDRTVSLGGAGDSLPIASLGSTQMAGSFASPDLGETSALESSPASENSRLLKSISIAPEKFDAPVPSQRFEEETLEELGELNEAIHSSQEPKIPSTLGSAREEGADSEHPVVGRYEVLARIRSGAVGSVYLCRLSGTSGFRRLFAMKVLRTGHSRDDALINEFFREARALQDLHHPNVIGIVDAGTEREPYLVLDYVEGGSLFELCAASPTSRDPAPIVTIVLDALAGVSAVHKATNAAGEPLGLVHHDLTPHNLLVGVDGACRVADFGVARGGPTAPGTPQYGKPGYVAPERYLGAAGDERSDIFSLGVVLYVALTGVEPFAAETDARVRQNVLRGKVAPPSEVGLRPPPDFDWLCQKALALSAKERFQSAEEMLIALRRIATKSDLLASPSQVAAWVKSTMGEKLKARRDAILSPAEQAPRISEAPPPFEVATPGLLSATRPPSSYATREKTAAIPSAPAKSAPEETTPPGKKRQWGPVVAIVLALLTLAAVVLGPWLDQWQAKQRGSSKPPSTESKPSPAPVVDEGTDTGVVIPKIKPAQD